MERVLLCPRCVPRGTFALVAKRVATPTTHVPLAPTSLVLGRSPFRIVWHAQQAIGVPKQRLSLQPALQGPFNPSPVLGQLGLAWIVFQDMHVLALS